MSGTAVAAPPVVNFDNIVKIAGGTTTALRLDAFQREQARRADPNSPADPSDAIITNTRSELMATAPSLIASKACDANEVIVQVRRGHALWSQDLERACRAEVKSRKSPGGRSVEMRVVYI